MGKRPKTTTQEYLTSAPLPEQTETYTVISHQTVIDATKKTLNAMGFEIEREFYRCNEGAQIASAVYHLKYGDDPDIGMLFAWANSYDKSMRFKCSVGGYVHESLVSIIAGNMGSWGRKHTGDADDETVTTIDTQLINAEEYFKVLMKEKDTMKNIFVSDSKRAEVLGKMYFEHELLTTEQMSVIKQEFNKPSHIVSGIENSLWKMYHAILVALQKAHPKTWMDQQRLVHELLQKEFLQNVGMPVIPVQNSVVTENKQEVIANQLDLEDVIKEIEAEVNPIADSVLIDEILGKPETNDFEDLTPTDVTVEIKVEEDLAPWNDEAITVDDSGWPCVQCGQMQDITSVWNDGQLCSSCFNNN